MIKLNTYIQQLILMMWIHLTSSQVSITKTTIRGHPLCIPFVYSIYYRLLIYVRLGYFYNKYFNITIHRESCIISNFQIPSGTPTVLWNLHNIKTHTYFNRSRYFNKLIYLHAIYTIDIMTTILFYSSYTFFYKKNKKIK